MCAVFEKCSTKNVRSHHNQYWIGLDWTVQCFTSPPTQYRLYGRRFLQVKRPNQQYRSTEGKSTKVNHHFWLIIIFSFFCIKMYINNETLHLNRDHTQFKQESPADADKPTRRKSMQKLLQFDVVRFISPNSISPNFKLPMHSIARYV